MEALRDAGRRRIVLIIAGFSRKPYDSPVTRAFRDELSAAGARVGDYNIPDRDETPEGLHALLGSLFKTTPPTDLFCRPAPSSVGRKVRRREGRRVSKSKFPITSRTETRRVRQTRRDDAAAFPRSEKPPLF